MDIDQNKIIIFQEKQIRRIWYNEEWYFSVLDIVEVLAETSNATDYFKKMRKRDEQLQTFVGTNCPQVEMVGTTGKKRKTLVANTETVFRIIQSITSPKAEPFKQWLAKVGYERVQEIENPELAAERARQYYRDLGYDEKWIETRLPMLKSRKNWKRERIRKNEGCNFICPFFSYICRSVHLSRITTQ
jgi:DNA-damage-inducible protein D